MLLNFVNQSFTFVMLLLLFTNFQQRKYKKGQRKRMAFLILASYYLLFFILLILVDTLSLPSWCEWVSLVLVILLAVLTRKFSLPFKRKCVKCGKKLSFDQWLGCDENLCEDCFYEKYPDLKPKEKEKPLTEEEINENFRNADKVDDIDWDIWEPTERCTLCYIIDRSRNEVLLIKKLRGMGEGYLNAPGGHIEDEETNKEAAVREVKEETGLTVLPDSLLIRGRLHFQFKDGIRMLGYVFFSYSYSGTLLDKTDETIPFWESLDNLDYSAMWEDDRLWLERAIKGDEFDGYFIFDDRKMIDSRIEFYPPSQEEDV